MSMIVKKSSVPDPDVVQEEKERRITNTKNQRNRKTDQWVWRKNKNGKVLLVPSGKDAWDLPDNWEAFQSDALIESLIIEEMVKGSSFHKISKKPGFPHVQTIYKWYYDKEDFRARVDLAKKQRADLYHDKLEEIATKTKESNSKSSKVKIDAYKFLMAVGDREQYGSQTKISGDANAPLNFVFSTGIERKDQNTIEAEGCTIDAKTQSQEAIPVREENTEDAELLAVVSREDE